MSGSSSRDELLSPEFLARLERLDFRIRRLQRGLQRGDVETIRTGSSTLFREHRAYVAGDDPRFVDWNAFMRTGQLHVKKFQAEERPHIFILLDGSASMGLHGGAKWRMASRVAASLGGLALMRHAVLSLRIFPGRQARTFSGRGAIPELLASLASARPEGQADFVEATASMLLRHRGVGMAFLLSDWMDTRNHAHALKRLRHMGFATRAIWIDDASDRNLQPDSSVALTDPETGHSIRIPMTRAIIDEYLRVLDLHEAAFATLCRQLEIPLDRISASGDCEAAVLRVVQSSTFGA